MAWLTRTLTTSIGKKGIMAASGLLLGLFVVVHLAGNSTAFFGRAAFLAYAGHLHALGFLIPVFETLLLATFTCHVILAGLLFFDNRQARPSRYAVKTTAGGSTLASRSMIYTGIIVLLFIVVHLANFHFSKTSLPIADLVADILQHPPVAVFYITAVLALALHISHGFWSLFQSLGLEHPKYSPMLKKGAFLLAILTGSIFSLITLAALTSTCFLR